MTLRKPLVWKIVAVIAVGAAAFALYEAGAQGGPKADSLQFSPDGKYLAYLHYRYERSWAISKTLPDPVSISLRWRVVGSKASDQEVLLFPGHIQESNWIDARSWILLFCPDSTQVAVLTPQHIVIVNLSKRSTDVIRLDEPTLIDGAWPTQETLIYLTCNEGRTVVWRQPMPAGGGKVAKGFEEMGPDVVYGALREHQWSPCGKYTLITSNKDPHRETALLDLTSGTLTPLFHSLSYSVWAPDGSALIVRGQHRGQNSGHQIAYVETATGAVTDLTQNFTDAFAGSTDLTFIEPLLTVDSKYLILYSNHDTAPKDELTPWTHRTRGHLVQLKPWKPVLTTDQILRWSPIAGWVLLQGDDDFKWIDYSGQKTIPLKGWPNDWTWSPGGKWAALVKDRSVELIEPSLPRN